MVKVRSEKGLGLMRESGRITALALRKVLQNIRAGVSGLELDKIAEEEIKKLGGEPSFKTVDGYRWTICITINEEVVHGIPTERKLKDGDLVSIDLGTLYKGWHTDAAWSVLVGGEQNEEKKRFLEAGEEAMWAGVKKAVNGKRIGDISAAIQGKVEDSGYSVVRSLIGHGVGRELHEEPEVPGFGTAHRGMELKAGMTLAIEAIYNMGSFEVELAKDGWTYLSADRSLAGLFEMSVIVGRKEAKVLTDWRKVKGL
ncbi:MAG: Methionine aminopeptidase [Microgenomates group bacterium Gr01-1014_80]|nr:MAG: Methionine aminopeptidase [Microgenomates group bacterium Gr01-1014_80]